MPTHAGPLLELDGLRKEFGGRHPNVAVDDVSLEVREGETMALVGESGCGKTTLTRLLLGLLEPTAGSVRFDGQDLAALTASQLRGVRRQMQVVLQDPYSSMNPRMRITDIVAEPLVTHDPEARGRRARARNRQRVGELLEAVGLDAGIQDRYPHEFSGGQRQRVSIARALALHPRLLVLDEPTSALDVSVQATVLDLLADLQQRLGLTYVFVSHNLAVVAQVADRVAVMSRGSLVEVGEAAAVLRTPRHPYTRQLLDAVPVLDPRRGRRAAARASAPTDGPTDAPTDDTTDDTTDGPTDDTTDAPTDDTTDAPTDEASR
ncbi:ATP-binding cassette domain-containing protein [Streptomyces anthocyanicus]|uniref:ATP-binding cassette domain-containing protein n=1 Tax=Streptomyces anthocyanicus TaxID=68174 RepID=UPI003628BD99